jgi:hypothetical protein
MSLIASPLFKTDASEELTSADAYEITDTKPINKLFDAAKGMGEKLIDRGGGANNIARSVAAIMNLKSSGATGRQLLEAGMGMFGSSGAGILKSASESILNKAGGFLDLSPEFITKVQTTAGDVAYQIQYGDPTNIMAYSELTGLIGSLTEYVDITEYVNIGYEAAVWAGTLATAVEEGVGEYIGIVRDFVDVEVYQQALRFITPTVAYAGEMTSLNHLFDNLPKDEIMACQPDFIPTFLSRFKLPGNLGQSMEDTSVELIGKMKELDPRWYLYDQNGTDIIDMKYIATMSDDVKRLLELDDEIGHAVQLARHYPEATIAEITREQYPLMVSVA